MAENEEKTEETPEENTPVEETPSEEPVEETAEETPEAEETAETDAVEEEAVEAEAEDTVEAEAEEAEEEVEEEPEPVVEAEPEEKKVPVLEKLAKLTEPIKRKDNLPDFRPGDHVKVHVKIIEGSKERIQVFEGVVIAIKHAGIDKTFTVRKTSWGVGVERSFFYHSPKVAKVDIVRKGRVRRAKLYYLRERAGKSARIKEKRMNK